ncbi:MAG: radical SAM protein, partial [Desulfuromonadaceae bacterium]
PFCASGSRGLLRNLRVEELWQQLERIRSMGLEPQRLTLSGIGEPLHNFDAVRIFIEECQKTSLPVSLTTSGGPLERFREALQWPHNGLMLSLHAGTPEIHRRLVPRAPEFNSLIDCLQRTLPALSRRRRRRLGINYLLLQGINEDRAEFLPLLPLFRRFPELTLHLLVCNPVPGADFSSPPAATIDALHGWLVAQGMHVRRPNPWRIRQSGGCGTLFVGNL